MATSKETRQEQTERNRLDVRLEIIDVMLEAARAIVDALETGATAETSADALHAIQEAARLSREIVDASGPAHRA